MKHQVLNLTVEGRPIEIFSSPQLTTQSQARVLLKAGVHGDEPEGVELLKRFLKESFHEKFHKDVYWCILPIANPDGVLHAQRVNANGVDLNRNFPTKDWMSNARAPRYFPGPSPASEIETQTLCQLVETLRPTLIISLHNYSPMVNINGECGLAAEKLAALTGYTITDHMGYETPGSFGRWAWEACRVPTITLEIEDSIGIDQIWPKFGLAIVEAVNVHCLSLR